MIRQAIYGITAAALLALCLIVVMTVQQRRVERLQAQAAALKTQVQALQAQEIRRLDQEAARAVIDTAYQEALKNAQTEIDSLRRDLASGVKRVYVRARCPDLPAATGTTRGADGAAAELTAAARSDYLDFRAALERQRQQLMALQSYVRTICQK